MLTKAFIAAQEAGLEVFLFFSVVRSGQFVGVARLTSRYKEDSFPFWWQSKKWKGHFNVQWLQVKDIVNKNFEHLNNVYVVVVIAIFQRAHPGHQIERWSTHRLESQWAPIDDHLRVGHRPEHHTQ